MSSGLRKASAQRNSSRSLGSFVDIPSASSSDFEPVDLEDMDSHSGGEGEAKSSAQPAMMGKNATPPAGAAAPPLGTVPEQTEAKPDAGGDSSQFAEPIQQGFHQFEDATHKAAELAKDFTNKLISSGAAEARSSVMKLAGDVSSWWAALDPGLGQPQDSPEQSVRSPQGSSEVQQLFGLPESEELMEKFGCTLLQTMECPHNSFSKPQQVKSSGRLYITDKNSCFNAEKIRFAIQHKDVKSITRVQEPAKGLRLEFGTSGEHVLFTDFKFSDLDSALGLLEHLTS